MTRTLLVTVFALLGCLSLSAQQAIFGTVVDETGEPIIGGNVAVFSGTSLVSGTQTDFDGNYRINVDPGTYNIEFSYVGYTPRRIDGFEVLIGQENKLDMEFDDDGGIVLETAIVKAYKVDPMRVDETSQGITLTSEDVKQLGTRSINAIASISAGATSSDEGEAVSIRGGRTNATQYVVDGIRVTGALPPETEIEQIQVVTGGVEAKYGDLSSGLINITTKGPSSQFRGYVEAESSKLLDAYNNNLVGISLSGPIIKRALPSGKERTLLGYRLTGRYTYQEDDDPPATDIYSVNAETRERLEANPIRLVDGVSVFPEAAFLEREDVDVLEAQPFEEFKRLDLTGKIDARVSDAIDITLTGNYADRSDQFTPGEGSTSGINWRLLNAHNNPFDYNNTWRGNLRFRHRLGAQSASNDTTSLISNALYTLQLGFQRNTSTTEDSRHGDNFFDYGYIGNFNFSNDPVFGPPVFGGTQLEPTITIDQLGYTQVFRGFTPGTTNPVLANYNKLGREDFSETGINDYLTRNGFVSRLVSDGVYSLHTNVGAVYNNYDLEKNDLLTFNLQTQFDLRPGRGKLGTHNIQLGVLYEQRVNRGYFLDPRDLWTTARQLGNSALQNIDTTSLLSSRDTIIFDPRLGTNVVVTVNTYNYEFDEANLGRDSRFYRELRNRLGVGEREFVNVDGLTPDQLSIDMFSAAEATQNQELRYYGYDYTGKETSANIAWEDFFTERDANGARTFPVAPIQPIYVAGYLQDKFNFKNIIMRAGVRVDYYDANTKVLKDPYELYDIQTVQDFTFEEGYEVPGNIPSTAKVYLETPGGTAVKAFRDGDTWFTAEGTQVNRAAEIFTGIQNPAFVDGRANAVATTVEDPSLARGQNYIRSSDFDVDASFKDYEAQINFMPRLAFSFPISEDANFFAHYDVLVQRPPSNTVATALDYFYFYENVNNRVFNNPNLLPTRTVDYEAGFQQRISASSALKLSFFVREMRDMVQRRTYLFAAGGAGRYTTFDNQDFGTVKGLNVSYDLRRTGPVSVRLNYGLQFADGTGSDQNSQAGSLTRGNLRTLYPLSFDERHRVSGSIDYRYGRNEGPEIFGINPLENFGVNIFGSAVSGRPYTRSRIPDQLGGRGNDGDINGARLPWNLVMNLRVDRNFDLFAENGKGVNMNVYLRVSNLLDRRNIIQVYSATGSPVDDGYLQSPEGSLLSNSQLNEEAFVRSYQWRLLNPNFYSLPRRFFLGASFSF